MLLFSLLLFFTELTCGLEVCRDFKVDKVLFIYENLTEMEGNEMRPNHEELDDSLQRRGDR